MINPQSITEKLLFSTIRIEGLTDVGKSVGTGFFYNIGLDNTRVIKVILTNKHVISGCKELFLYFHEADINNQTPLIGKYITINLKANDIKEYWLPHPDESIDLGAIFFVPIENATKNKMNKNILYTPLDKSLIKSDSELAQELGAVEEVLMTGYPNGLWDSINNLPLIRKGVTAYHPALNFENLPIGVIDMACFPGSSGSPILIVNQGGYAAKTGEFCIGTRVIFLGLLYAGPQIINEVTLEIKEIPTNAESVPITKLMMHLGYYVKAKEVLNFEQYIKNRHGS